MCHKNAREGILGKSLGWWVSPSEKLPEIIEGKTKDKGDGMQGSETAYYKAEAAKVNRWSSDKKAASCEEMP